MVVDHIEQLPVVWCPKDGAFEHSPLGRMAAHHGITGYAELRRRAAQEPDWYWAAAAEDLGLRWMHPYDAVTDLSGGVEFPRFFAGGRLNWADYAVDRWIDQGHGDAVAIAWEGDDGTSRIVTYRDLKADVDKAAGALRASGVAVGDTVALLLPMVPEAAVALFAIAKIGAIAAPLFSGYGPPAIRERIAQAGARVVITCDSFLRRGRQIPLKVNLDDAIGGLPMRRVIVVERSSEGAPMTASRDRWWHELLAQAEPFDQAVPMGSNEPCLLLFTSGSTGRPKGCLHAHAGLPFKFALEARHSLGLDESGSLLWLTDMGWVMGSAALAAALGNGAAGVMFEGVPDWPEPDRLWAVAERTGASVLGVSPTAIRSLMRHGEAWPRKHDLAALEVIASTGEPWNLEPWLWCFRHVGRERLPIVNISGGTECGGSLVSGTIFDAAKPMSFAGPSLGLATDVVDEKGRSVRSEIGELVVRAPWPGMTSGLWNDRELYLETYWRRYPDMWHQGDHAYVDADGLWFLLGRSDDTMTVAGKRVGPAEVESAVVADEDVIEAAAVGVPDDLKGEAIIVLVVLRSDVDGVAIRSRLEDLVRTELGRSLAPKEIIPVPDLPRTRSGKVMRRLIRNIYTGDPVGDTSALENPGVLPQLPVAATRDATSP